MHLLSIILGFILDLILGDPYSFPHPVRYMGKLIRVIEKGIRKYMKTPTLLKVGGGILWVITVSSTYLITYFVIKLSSIHFLLYVGVNSLLIYTALATKCLKGEAVKIYRILGTGSIEESRKQLSYIVGRDTEQLTEKEIIRATIETVAENTSDGIIAPLFYAFIGGAPLALMYKAINTLDSMVGYQNEKYKDIGYVSAKLDDIANFIPARLTAGFMIIASLVMGLDSVSAFKIAIRDRKNHKSPNCAYPEGAAAGALGIQLGGTNTYFGEKVFKPTIGDKVREMEKEDIIKMNKLMYGTAFVAVIFFSLIFIILVL